MHKELIEVFYLRLEEYRIKARLSGVSLARAFNMDRATMARYRDGKKLPTTDMIIRLAELWGMSVSELLMTDREENVEEKRKRIFLQEIWEVVEKFNSDPDNDDTDEKKDTKNRNDK